MGTIMGKLFIAEKPSLAKAIYTELGIQKRGDGFVLCKNGHVVTWCFGHMLEQATPDFYLPDEGKKLWRKEDLPIFPTEWHLDCRIDPKTQKADTMVKKQLSTIKKLLASKDIDTIVNAGDPDREGQLLVDEVLEYYGNRKPVLRFWASAIDSVSIQKALANLQPNARFEGMKLSALARSRADWLLGMNLSRGYTLAQPPTAKGQKRPLIAVGRVQTPTLMMVAIRDRAISEFKPVPYLSISAQCESKGQGFRAKWQPKDDQAGMNEDHTMLLDFDMGKSLIAKLKAFNEAEVLSVESKKNQKSAPTPMSLADIQIKASSAFGFTAEQTLNICQSLYEKHKCASYPRTDCGFLPESQFSDAPKVLSAIAKTCPELAPFVQKANPKIKSKAWNDSKVTAHHGIIPTTMSVDWSAFSSQEKAIYKLIAQHYLAQFFPNFEYLSTKCGLRIGDEKFLSEGKVTLQAGWRAVLSTKEEGDQALPTMKEGDKVRVTDILGKEDQTKPPSAYTEGKLIEDMERIYKAFADYPSVRNKLKETNGIGTPATRASIIAELRRKGYLEEKGKKLHVSAQGLQVLNKVSRKVSSVVLTAQWEEKLEMIEKGSMKLDVFIKDLEAFIVSELKAMQILSI